MTDLTLNRWTLAIEAAILMLAVTALLGFVTISEIQRWATVQIPAGAAIASAWDLWGWPQVAAGFLRVFSLAALLSAWHLIVTYFRGGATAARAIPLIWWLLASLGAAVLASAWLSMALPASVPYSRLDDIRQDLQMFRVGTVLLIPYLHLLLSCGWGGANHSFERSPDGPVTPLAEQPARQSQGAAQLKR